MEARPAGAKLGPPAARVRALGIEWQVVLPTTQEFYNFGCICITGRLVYKGIFLGPTFRESDVVGVVLGLGMGI